MIDLPLEQRPVLKAFSCQTLFARAFSTQALAGIWPDRGLEFKCSTHIRRNACFW